MIFFYPTKFHFNTINSFGVMGRGALPAQKSPGRIGLKLVTKSYMEIFIDSMFLFTAQYTRPPFRIAFSFTRG